MKDGQPLHLPQKIRDSLRAPLVFGKNHPLLLKTTVLLGPVLGIALTGSACSGPQDKELIPADQGIVSPYNRPTPTATLVWQEPTKRPSVQLPKIESPTQTLDTKSKTSTTAKSEQLETDWERFEKETWTIDYPIIWNTISWYDGVGFNYFFYEGSKINASKRGINIHILPMENSKIMEDYISAHKGNSPVAEVNLGKIKAKTYSSPGSDGEIGVAVFPSPDRKDFFAIEGAPISDNFVQRMVASFEFKNQGQAGQSPAIQPKSPDVDPKPVILEGKLSKKPEELFRTLLTTLISDNDLPPGFSSKGNSADNLDATAQAFKAIGKAKILVSDNDPRFGSMPNSAISYTVFPDRSGAKGTYDVFATQSTTSSGRRNINIGQYPAIILSQPTFGATTTGCALVIDNVFVVSIITSVGQNPNEAGTVSLAESASSHLLRVGR